MPGAMTVDANRMRRFLVAVGCALVIGCGPKELTLPVTVEGMFTVSVEKGPVDDKGVSEANFGTLVVDGVQHLVQVSGTVLGAAKLPREGAKVKATLGSRTDQYGPPTYIITAIERR
jgi:hypothetical protein